MQEANTPDGREVTIRIPWAIAEPATKSMWAFRNLGASIYRSLKAHVALGWTEPVK